MYEYSVYALGIKSGEKLVIGSNLTLIMVQYREFGLFGVYKRNVDFANIIPITTKDIDVQLSFSSGKITFTFSGDGSVEAAAFIRGQKISSRHTYFEY